MATKAEKAKPKLSDYAHEAWIRWMKKLFEVSVHHADGTVTISRYHVDRWKRQMKTEYINLSDIGKDTRDAEADRIIEVIDEAEEL